MLNRHYMYRNCHFLLNPKHNFARDSKLVQRFADYRVSPFTTLGRRMVLSVNKDANRVAAEHADQQNGVVTE